jgi:ketosteroid isomerase-like protein
MIFRTPANQFFRACYRRKQRPSERHMNLLKASAIAILTVVFLQTRNAPAAEADKSKTASTAEFQAMLEKVDAAQLELQNGKPAAFKALWSQADDITLSGGFGGTVEKGWGAISRRLDWVGAQFSGGTHTHERVVANTSGDLGYVVQLEHLRFKVPADGKETSRDYRVTMIFRREADGWRIIHRQADAQMTKQAPK